jgi:hypothetical protein
MSFDGGATWHLAALSTWERGTPSGRHWCAVAWSFALADARELLLADEVACRAWDAASNTQPAELTWNLKGMGNNCWCVCQHPSVVLCILRMPCLTHLSAHATDTHAAAVPLRCYACVC